MHSLPNAWRDFWICYWTVFGVFIIGELKRPFTLISGLCITWSWVFGTMDALKRYRNWQRERQSDV
jgi:hypothetical protein